MSYNNVFRYPPISMLQYHCSTMCSNISIHEEDWLVHVLNPPQKFQPPPFENVRSYGIINCSIQVPFNGIICLPNFMNVFQPVQKLLVKHTQKNWWYDKPLFNFEKQAKKGLPLCAVRSPCFKRNKFCTDYQTLQTSVWLIMSMGWDLRLRTAATNEPIVHSWWYVSGEPWWWWCWLGKTPESSARVLWQSCQKRHLATSRRNGRRSENFAYQYLRYVNGSQTCRKYYNMGPPALRPIRRKFYCWFFSPLKIHHLGCVWTRAMGPVASTLTTTPRRRLVAWLALMLRIWAVPGSILASETDNPDWGKKLKVMQSHTTHMEEQGGEDI
jgi:hypothetical protein